MTLRLRVTPAERAEMERRAAERDCSLSELVRCRVLGVEEVERPVERPASEPDPPRVPESLIEERMKRLAGAIPSVGMRRQVALRELRREGWI